MFKSEDPSRTGECSNCGAQLPPPDAQGNRKCQYCEAVYHVPPEGGPQITVVFGNPGVVPPTVAAYNPAAVQNAVASANEAIASAKRSAAIGNKVGCFISLLVTVAILAGVGVAIYSGVSSSGFGGGVFGSGQALRPSSGAALALPGEPTGPITVALGASRYEGTTNYYVVKADVSSGQTLWQSAPLGDSAYNIQLAYDLNSTYAADRTRVFAFANTDGSTRWQASLSDDIDTSCRGTCFTVFGNRLITKSRDGVLTAFDVTTGAPAWTRRLGQTAAQVIPTAQRLVIVDHIGTDSAVVVLNPTDGSETGRLDPRCRDPKFPTSTGYGPSISDVALSIPFSDSVVLAWNSNPACVQKWDAVTGQMAWNTYLDDVSATNSPAAGQIPGPTGVYLSLDDRVFDVDSTDGHVRQSWQGGQDLKLAAYRVSDQALVMQGESTRGTTKSSLVVVNPTSGQQVANIDIGTAEPSDGPFGSPSSSVTSSEVGFTAALDGTTLHVVQLRGDNKKLMFDSFDAVSGRQLGEGRSADPQLGSGSATFDPVQWRGDRLVVNLSDRLDVLDTTNATITSRWPT